MRPASKHGGRRIQNGLCGPRMCSRLEYWIMNRSNEKQVLEMQKLRQLLTNLFREERAQKNSGDEEREDQRYDVYKKDKIHKKAASIISRAWYAFIMLVNVCIAKLHRATVTDADLNYDGPPARLFQKGDMDDKNNNTEIKKGARPL